MAKTPDISRTVMEALDGKSIKDALDLYVLDDNAVREASAEAARAEKRSQENYRMTWDGIWSLVLDAPAEAQQLAGPQRKSGTYIDGKPPMSPPRPTEVRQLFELIFEQYNRFFDLLRDSFLVADGRTTTFGEREPIDANFWISEDHRIDVVKGKLVTNSSGTWNTVFEMIKLKVPALQPIDPAELEGLSLVDGFQRFVLGDPAVAAAAEEAAGCHSMLRHLAQTGMMDDNARYWHLVSTPEELLYRQIDRAWSSILRAHAIDRESFSKLSSPREMDPRPIALAEALHHVFERFVAPYRSGDLGAFDMIGDRTVPAALWSTKGYWFDVRDGDIGRMEGENPVVKYEALVARRPVAEGRDIQKVATSQHKDKGGRRPEHEWHVVFDRVLLKWLYDEDPKSKEELAKWMELEFEDLYLKDGSGRKAPHLQSITRWLREEFPLLYEKAKAGKSNK